jgi:hypothetical protein
MDEAWELSKHLHTFGNRGALDEKELSLFIFKELKKLLANF